MTATTPSSNGGDGSSGGKNERNITTIQEPRPPMWKVWILASRPHTLTASIAPVLVGHSCAATSSNTFFLQTITLSWLFFCILIQLGTNLHNDYADFVMGADTCKRVGQARATQKGWLSPQQTCAGSTLTLTLALAIGLQLINKHGRNDLFLWFIILSSVFNAVAYTGGPFPLGYIGMSNVSIAYSGLGDVFCFAYFGLVATLVIPYLCAYTGDFLETWQRTDTLRWTSTSSGILGYSHYRRQQLERSTYRCRCQQTYRGC